MKISKILIHRSVALALAFFVALITCFGFIVPAKAEEREIAKEPVKVIVNPNFGSRTRGAKMQLLSEDGTVLEEWTSEKDSHIIETELYLDTSYILHQVTPLVNGTEGNTQYNWENHFGLGYDATFIIKKQADGSELISYQYYKRMINHPEGEIIHKTEGNTPYNKDTIFFECPLVMSVEIGMESLGTSANPDEYFEVILDIPHGVPGQVMSVDLSNADENKNPSEVVIPESGSLTASFWLKDGQSILVDGFPFMAGDYYSVYENNETLNKEAYITKIRTMEYMHQVRADSLLAQGIVLIGKRQPFPMQAVFLSDEITDNAYDAMNQYANEKLFALDDSVIDFELPEIFTESVVTDTLGVTGGVFSVSDTLSDHNETTRTASKRGDFPALTGTPLVSHNGVYGDAKILFINRRDGVPISKTDEQGHLIGGAKLEILDAEGSSVHTFQSSEEITRLIALAPGEYTLHEISAPKGYEAAEDIPFTVVDESTVQVDGTDVEVLTMIDKKLPEAETEITISEEKTPSQPPKTDNAKADKPKTGDNSNIYIWIIAAGCALAVLVSLCVYYKKRHN